MGYNNVPPPDYISFAAHTDYEGNSEFIKALNPPHLVSAMTSQRYALLVLLKCDAYHCRYWCTARLQ